MSTTIMSNAITTGVRRLNTLGNYNGVMGWDNTLGTAPDQTTIAELVVTGGYDMGDVNTLIAMGATNEQLQALPYPASAAERSAAFANLMNRLGGALASTGMPASSAGSYPQSAQPTTINTSFGVFDLLQQSSWDAINSIFVGAAQRLNALASRNPKDPDVVSMVSEFNYNVAQWANYYQQAVGQSPSPSAQVTLGALGILPIVIVGISVAVALLVGWLYGFITGKIAQKEQAQAALVSAQTQSALVAQYNTAVAKGDTKTAAALLPAIQSAGNQPLPGATDWSTWFQKNIGLLMLGLIGVAVVPPLLKRR